MSDQVAPVHGTPAGQPGLSGRPWAPLAPAEVWPPLHKPSNGVGYSALVLGIVAAAFLCLGGASLAVFPTGLLATALLWWPCAALCGVLAVIFGLIGLGKARRGEATNRGAALAGLICGSVAALAVVTALVLFVVAVQLPLSR